MNDTTTVYTMEADELEDDIVRALKSKGHSARMDGRTLHVMWIDQSKEARPNLWNHAWSAGRITDLGGYADDDGEIHASYCVEPLE